MAEITDPRLIAMLSQLAGQAESGEPDEENEDEGTEETEASSEETEESEDEELGPKGEKALKAERAAKNALRAELRRQGYKFNKDGTFTAPKKAAGRKVEDADEIREQVRSELAKEFGVKRAKDVAESELLSAGYLGSTKRGVASLFADLDMDDIVYDGDVDRDALREAVAAWKEDEPRVFKRSRSRDEDDEEDEAPRKARRRTNGDPELGRKKTPSTAKDPLEQLIRNAVGQKHLL